MKKIAPIFILLLVVLTSCSTDSFDTSVDNRNSVQTVVDPIFMSGDMNGIPYSNLKPQTYTNVTCLQTEVETYQMTSLISHNYLLLQGSDITLSETPQSSSILVDIRIPECKWAVGTYNLEDEVIIGINGNDCIASLVEIGGGTKTRITSGSLTITEFNLSTNTIKGTFSFTYQRRNGTTYLGSYHLNNGAFNYKLDAPFFN